MDQNQNQMPFWWRREVRTALGILFTVLLIFGLKFIYSGKEASLKQASVEIEQKYDQVVEGMTLAEVEAIMGGPGETVTKTTIAGVESHVVKWVEGTYNSANMTFIDGKLNSKILIN